MQITLALNRDNRRDLRMFAGDQITIDLIVYAEDGDDTTITATSPVITVSPASSASFLVGTQFTVPDECDRMTYRLTASIGGITRTLCYGVIVVSGATNYGSSGDYGGPSA